MTAIILAFGLAIVGVPIERASAQTSPSGPTKRVIVRYSNVLGSSTEDPAENLSGYIKKEQTFNNLPFAVYTTDSLGESSLQSSGVALEVFEDKILEYYGDLPIPTIGGDPAAGTFTDTVSSTAYNGSGYAVAIIDTGIDKTHSAFMPGQVVHEACFGTNDASLNLVSLCPAAAEFSNAVDSGLDCSSSIAGCGHGTFAAGAAAMRPGFLFDVDQDTVVDENLSGVATGANLISLRLGTQASGVICGANPTCAVPLRSDIFEALDYLITLDVGVPIAAANLSFGGGNFADLSECQADSAYGAYSSAFAQLRNRGIAPVVATGNGGDNPGEENTIGSPACVEGAIATGATNILGNALASYSNNGSLTDILSPGGDFNGTNADTAMWLPVSGNSPGFLGVQGTSFAAPMVSGVFAVLREKHPDATPDQLLQLLQDTGVDVTDTRTGYTVGAKKRINLASALSTSTVPTITSFTGPSGTVNEGSDTELTITTTEAASCSLSNGIGVLSTVNGTVTVPGFADYTLTCTGNFSDTATSTFSPTTFNTRPAAPADAAAPVAEANVESRSMTFSWAASTDPDGVDFYRVFLDGAFVETTTETSYTFTDLSLNLEYTATVTAVDTLGAESVASAPTTFVLAATTAPAVSDTGVAELLSSVGSNAVVSFGAIISTGLVLAIGRRFFL